VRFIAPHFRTGQAGPLGIEQRQKIDLTARVEGLGVHDGRLMEERLVRSPGGARDAARPGSDQRFSSPPGAHDGPLAQQRFGYRLSAIVWRACGPSRRRHGQQGRIPHVLKRGGPRSRPFSRGLAAEQRADEEDVGTLRLRHAGAPVGESSGHRPSRSGRPFEQRGGRPDGHRERRVHVTGPSWRRRG